MAEQKTDDKNTKEQNLEGGAYEIIKKRLSTLGEELLEKIKNLNESRKKVFGALESRVLNNDRIITENNCNARDMVSVGNKLIFAYNVFIGLKKETKVSDVFSVYELKKDHFEKASADFFEDANFKRDFLDLYRYYKKARFAMFYKKESMLLIIFQTGDLSSEIKAFKFNINADSSLSYINNRSEVDYKLPNQHDFEWKLCTREQFVYGKHPHVSIEDKLFVETIGGDLTIKVENNTASGEGIYAEEVDKKDQKLEDGEIHYSILGDLIALKILPYTEQEYRYFIYDSKKKKVTRVNDMKSCAVLLPDEDGLIFPGGYYLLNQGYKEFKIDTAGMQFLQVSSSPNGEDYLYIFYNEMSGEYILMQYNIIEKRIDSPIRCNGYALYDNGILVFFKASEEASKSHAIQIWQTPFVKDVSFVKSDESSYLSKLGNSELVKGIADLKSIERFVKTQDIYLGLYHEIVKKVVTTLDLYFWLDKEEVFNVKETLLKVKDAAQSAINEYEKVVEIKKSTQKQIQDAQEENQKLLNETETLRYDHIDHFIYALSEFAKMRGKLISLKELRYADLALIEELEQKLVESQELVSKNCVDFLLTDHALKPVEEGLDALFKEIPHLKKVTQAEELSDKINQVNENLDMLNDLVSSLNIEDATKTAEIIERLSLVYSKVNQIKSVFKKQKKSLSSKEAILEFNAQYKLINQMVMNYLDQAQRVEDCEKSLTKIMISIEELESKFSDFEEFIAKLTEKREEVYSSFNNKKVLLQEALNKRTNSLYNSADRILKGVLSRLKGLKSIEEMNGYFASDSMILKVKDIIRQLFDLKDTVKAEDIQSRLKSIQQDGVRQLKDKIDLYADAENIIKLGNFKFTVNTQKFGLTTVMREQKMFFHLTGTEFFEEIENQSFNDTKEFWDQSFVSENKSIYKSEFLAYKMLLSVYKEENPYSLKELSLKAQKEPSLLTEDVKKYMENFYDEGYEKGIHDLDSAKILASLAPSFLEAKELKYHPQTRAAACIFWFFSEENAIKTSIKLKLYSLGILSQLAEKELQKEFYIQQLDELIQNFYSDFTFSFEPQYLKQSSAFLSEYLQKKEEFPIDKNAFAIYDGFKKFLNIKSQEENFKNILKESDGDLSATLFIIKDWLLFFMDLNKRENNEYLYSFDFIDEALFLLLFEHKILKDKKENPLKKQVKEVKTAYKISSLMGEHPKIQNGELKLDLSNFLVDLQNYVELKIPRFNAYKKLKTDLTQEKQEQMRLDSFKPRILTSFVRNKLIDELYLNLVGANLAKQMGAAGEQKRTDLMGLLLLISPPGYGKTTLMEYIADRLGLIFMKINGPAIGNKVTSLDPQEAGNATAKEEIEKLNLALEMGNNVMLYLDDIQHCNPEFLQKFISLCDAQRKIEGVYKGKSKTYDLRGKKFCVIMAGNPYTESGSKFQIPDMLANRADIYNLGDIIGGSAQLFELSYLENCLTSNTALNRLSSKSQHDVYELIKIAKTGSSEGSNFESKFSISEIEEMVNVFKKLLKIQEVVLKVNQLYIYSAAQDEAYRKEPKFLLQGSYRNMNKMAEKVLPIMNERELTQLIIDHYNDESQLLTTGAEFNFLRFKEMCNLADEKDLKRLLDIRSTFKKNKALGSSSDEDAMGKIIGQMNLFNDQFLDLSNVLRSKLK